MDQPTRQFVRELTDHQSRLYAYIFSLVGEAEAAGDVLQETNLVLWEKSAEAMAAKSFTAWAYGVAHRKVLTYWQSKGRDRHVFDESLLSMIASESEAAADETAGRLDRLNACISRLPEQSKRVLTARYESGHPMSAIAKAIGRSLAATTQLLYRTRLTLLECMERGEAGEEQR